MINTNYSDAYKEVLIVLNNLSQEDYEKIPRKYIEFLEANCNNNNEFKYDTSKNFDEQDLLDESKYILFGLFEKFGATDVQKSKINSFKISFNNKLEEQKRKDNSYEDLFKNRQNNIPLAKNEVVALVEYKEPKWYQKLFKKFMKIFKKT